MSRKLPLVSILFFTALGSSVFAAEEAQTLRSDYDNEPGFGGPGSISAQLEEEDELKVSAFQFESFDEWLQPWFDGKARINEDLGVQIGVDYNYMMQGANESLNGDDLASSGIFRLYGKWDVFNKDSVDKGSFFAKVEHRHRIGDITPAQLAGEIGYAGLTGTLFTDTNLVLNEFNWQQYFNDGKTGLVLGRFDPNDYMDVSGYANPWTTFHNLSSLFNTSIALPDTSWGIGLGHWFNDSVYLVGSANDANGALSEIKGFEYGGELFKQVGFGYTPSRGQRYTHNLQVTYWDVDERKELGVPASDGIAVNANWTFDDQYMLWTRMGWSDGLAPIYQESYSVGFARRLKAPTNTFGVTVNWGDPAEPSLGNQTGIEAIYKLQVAQNMLITPSVQYIDSPALNPDEDSLVVWGVRLRISL
jgi:porin